MDASHTLIFESIQSGNATFTSSVGADYSGTREPASWTLVAAAAMALLINRRRL